MSLRKYNRTLVVSAQVIELETGIFLPVGQYPVIDERIVFNVMGTPQESPGRLVLPLTDAQLRSFGKDTSSTTVMSVEYDVRSDLEKGGVSLL